MPSVEYTQYLHEDLKNPEYAGGYLSAALDEGDDVFLLAVRDVVQVQGGIAALSEITNLNRENLYKRLSRAGNPRLSSITAILASLGFRFEVLPMTDAGH